MTANDYLVGMHWHDVIVVGGGHNGLVAAAIMARRGLKVLVLEERGTFGGAARTERPFAKAPELATSTGAYLLGLMPPELMATLGLDLPTVRRDPHSFLPTTTPDRYLLLGADPARNKASFVRSFSEKDWDAHVAMHAELGKIRDDLAPAWLVEPLSLEETAERWIRKELRGAFVDLCQQPVGAYLDRWGFASDLVKAMYAVTDGFSGVYGSWSTPGTGMNFLVHNMGRLPEADGTWMAVRGGMGTVTRMIADCAIRAGAALETDAKVSAIVVEGNVARGVVLKDGTMHHATAVLCNADPFRMREMVGRERLPAEYNQRLDGYARDGSTLKVSLALSALPEFTCWPGGAFAQPDFAPTIHLLPEEDDVLRSLTESFEAAQRGQLPGAPPIEWYVQTHIDPSLRDPRDGGEARHDSTLFVQWVPYDLDNTTWEAEEAKYVAHLLTICDRFAPGTSDLVVDTFTLHPRKIEEHFGITRGHIHHVDNSFGFADRLPYATPVQGLYSCSAGAHPAGAVIGAAGHNAAMRVLADMGKDTQRDMKKLSQPPRGA